MEAGNEARSVTYSAVVSTTNTDRSPLISAIVPVLVFGLRLSVDLPQRSLTARNLARTGECVINLPGNETIAAIERLAQMVSPIGKGFDPDISRAFVDGTLTPAHMTLVPSEAISVLRALECPMQFEAKAEASDTMAPQRLRSPDGAVTFRLNVLRVHLDSSIVLSDDQPNMWTPLMACLREAYRTLRADDPSGDRTGPPV
jgi:flavin reductase (DIM6/NTAB) family NADH-FMN oxidoreductase RutF